MENNLKYLIACDTHPEHYYQKERLPAMKAALKGRRYNIIDIFGFENDEKGRQSENLITHGNDLFEREDLEKINAKFYERVMSYDFDILCLFTIGSFRLFLLPETINKIRKNAKWVVGVFGDDEYGFEHYKYWLPLFDNVVAYTKKEVEKYNELYNNVLHLPVGAHFDKNNISLNKTTEREKIYEVIFVGRPYGSREKNIEYLIDNGINIAVFGSEQWAKNKKIKPYYHGFLPNEKYDETVSKAKILIGFMEDYITGKPHINAKLFDAAKTNQFIITTHYPPFERDYGFEEGKHVVMYRSIEDLVDKIKYYLERPEERKRIADNLYKKVKEEYNYELLYTKLFNQIEEGYSKKENKNRLPKGNITIVVPLKRNKNLKNMGDLNMIYVTKNKKWVGNKVYYYKEFKKNYDKTIKTDYVILGDYSVTYSNFLDEYIDFLDRNFSFEKAVFDSISQNRNFKKMFIYDVYSVIWKKETFKKSILNKIFSKRIIIDFKRRGVHIPIYFNRFENAKMLLRFNLIYSFGRLIYSIASNAIKMGRIKS